MISISRAIRNCQAGRCRTWARSFLTAVIPPVVSSSTRVHRVCLGCYRCFWGEDGSPWCNYVALDLQFSYATSTSFQCRTPYVRICCSLVKACYSNRQGWIIVYRRFFRPVVIVDSRTRRRRVKYPLLLLLGVYTNQLSPWHARDKICPLLLYCSTVLKLVDEFVFVSRHYFYSKMTGNYANSQKPKSLVGSERVSVYRMNNVQSVVRVEVLFGNAVPRHNVKLTYVSQSYDAGGN